MKNNTFIPIIKGIGLWAFVFLSSVIISSILTSITRNTSLGAIIMQILFTVLSLAVVKFGLKREISIIGFCIPSLTCIIFAFSLSLIISTLIAYIEVFVLNLENSVAPIPGIMHETLLYYLIAFILAPIGEEILFRGLLIGYVIETIPINAWILVSLSAILFSSVHIIPFFTAPFIQQVTVISTAFILSIIAGYLYIQSRSVLPAIVVHLSFNLGGYIISTIA